MQQYSKIDEQGRYIEPVLVDDGVIIVDPYIIITPVPEGLYEPLWDGQTWVEGKPQAEIDAILAAPVPKTRIEQVEEENASLNLQLIDLWEQLLNKGVL